MRTILFILQKEFIQIFRNKVMLPVIFVVPLVQLIVLVNAATFEMKNIKTVVVDTDLSGTSRGLVSKIEGSPFYFINDFTGNIHEAEDDLLSSKTNLIIYIPKHFERKLYNNENPSVQLQVDAVNSTTASLIYRYTASIIAGYNRDIMFQLIGKQSDNIMSSVNILTRFWFNTSLNYKIYMTPAVLVILVTIIGIFLTALNIIREKEMGTLEQINVTPVKKYQFIIGKLLPFWIIGMVELTVGLTAGILIFHLPVEGSFFHLYVFATIYLVVALGFGLFISTLAESQQQVMFIAFFFMVTFILMSGIFTPAESMPVWAQKVNIINPFAYFIKAIRMILLKGSELKDISKEIYSLLVYAFIILSLAIWRYKKVS